MPQVTGKHFSNNLLGREHFGITYLAKDQKSDAYGGKLHIFVKTLEDESLNQPDFNMIYSRDSD
ncbi:hypothetical protein [Nostoc sp.]|uniref:hypothetical protein n=1 Tax=Nostoc sp. TaxID=1180 RepID=UPI002FFD5434